MKSVREKIRFFRRNFFILSTREFETSALTGDEVNQINAIIPRLCASKHLKEATDLISAALSTANPPPLTSLSLSPLINALALQPDLTHPMHLLNTLKHKHNDNGNPHFMILPIAKLFVSSFLRHGYPKRAVKIFQWVSRPDFPGGGDLEFYAALIDGFCRNWMVLDALHVLRVMATEEDTVIGSEVRLWIYRGLLREARVREAIELNAALGRSKEAVVDLLDQMIANWVD